MSGVSGDMTGEDAAARSVAPIATLQQRLYDECVTAGWDPNRGNTFAEECAHLHEEVSEAFRAWRLHPDAEIRYTYPDGIRAHPFRVWDYDAAEVVAYYDSAADAEGDHRGAVQRGKPEGVPIELADVLIGLFYNAEVMGFDLLEAVEIKHRYNLTRDYVAEGRQLHARPGAGHFGSSARAGSTSSEPPKGDTE